MNNRFYLGGISILLVITALGYLSFATHSVPTQAANTEIVNAQKESVPEIPVTPVPEVLISVDAPLPGENIASPLTITGTARGFWFFEASFPIELVDSNGVQIATTPAQAVGEWMTTDFVPFKATLTWSGANTTATSGSLILHRDNPSGMTENDAEISVPVLF